MTTKANAIHLSLGNPRTVCGRRLDETNRLTKLLAEVTCSQCERHAPESMKKTRDYDAFVSQFDDKHYDPP